MSSPVEYDDHDQPHTVAVEEFKLPKDSLRSVLAEIIAAKKPDTWTINQVCALVMDMSKEDESAIKAEGVRDFLTLVMSHPRKVLALYQAAFATGMLPEKTGPELAKKCGVSKQDFQQGADKMIEELSMRHTRTMRNDDAKRNMRISNYRHANKKRD